MLSLSIRIIQLEGAEGSISIQPIARKIALPSAQIVAQGAEVLSKEIGRNALFGLHPALQ